MADSVTNPANRPEIMRNILPAGLTLPILVALFKPLCRLLPGLDKDAYVRRTVEAGNRFYARRFRRTPFDRRLLFLPYCLRAADCPTTIDPDQGLTCPPECALPCRLREMRQLALDLGYLDAYIVVSGKLHQKEGVLRSRNFLVRRIEEHQPQGVIGCLCTRDLREKYLTPETIGTNGILGQHGTPVIPQVCLLDNSRCRGSQVNWQKLEQLIRSRE
ncbi:DUF116 domain-containing protein [Desulfurivibrio dismutans]|uniref:DUF116 domain-containing protein n=1 Tax=Desulfurivibrio dismutans TaxID=1398908 RepID=UPI0023DC1C5F|nr:DUF116 domain-containing protein [Desulfurivibrio alkaliphilus]MDF1615129.1 DUF116 domain-containing protein [Desulfurivibrio alkaliphilus]